MSIARTFRELGLQVLERGWLSSNNIVFAATDSSPASVVDTGYSLHASQTVELVESALAGQPLERIVNTHLHSDHCGGNASLQHRYSCETWVPAASFEAADQWDQASLSFGATDQRCERFAVHHGMAIGDELVLGAHRWEIVAAPGHDPDAVMLYEAESRTMITADALWEDRLAIIFPEIQGEPGFADARSTLDEIESRSPRLVIPGHGRPFTDVAAAIRRSRERLAQFETEPARHVRSASRALAMFRMLELQRVPREDLIAWLLAMPIFRSMRRIADSPEEAAMALVKGLVRDGLLALSADDVLTMS